MEPRRLPVFFYGLFMDADVLRSRGADPRGIRAASLDGYQLRVGRRAALAMVPGERTLGFVMELTSEELDRLYAEPSVRNYRPERVLVDLEAGERLSVLCYNLPQPPAPADADAEYAAALRSLAQRLGLPADYVARIR